MSECGIGIVDILCYDITYEDLHLASMVEMDDVICEHLTFDDLNPDVLENLVLGLMI